MPLLKRVQMIMKKMHYFRKMDGSDKIKRIYEEEKR
jgi:hypothetical protein